MNDGPPNSDPGWPPPEISAQSAALGPSPVTWAAPPAPNWAPPPTQAWPPPPTQAWPPLAPGTPVAPAPAGRRRRGLAGGLAAAAAAVAKYGVLLWKLKAVTVVGSMLISIAAYALLWGWTFAAGFVALLFVHEMGHAVEMRRQGLRASAPVFIPFMGAVIAMRSQPASAYQEATIGLAGPAAGTAASLVVALMAADTHSQFLRALAFIGFFLNLFNLFPALPLDGGRAVGALHPAIWLLGLIGLVGFEIWSPSPILLIVLIMGSLELWRRWKGRNQGASRTYHDLTAAQRAGIGVSYVGLVAFCLIGMHATYLVRTIGH
jgi:Zn-dependent protease